MSDNISFEWNFDEITNYFERMGKDIASVESIATQKAGKVVKDAVKRNLKRSNINHKHMQDDISLSSLKTDENQNRVRTISGGKKTGYKWKWWEFGTSKMSGNQFMSKSVNETANEVKNIMDTEIQKALNL